MPFFWSTRTEGFLGRGGVGAVRSRGRQVAAPRGPEPRVPPWPLRHVPAGGRCALRARSCRRVSPFFTPALGTSIPWKRTQAPSSAHSPRQGRGKLPGTGRGQGRQPAHPGAPSPVVDGRAQKPIHKIPASGEHRWCGREGSGVKHNSAVLLALSFRTCLGRSEKHKPESLRSCCEMGPVVLGCAVLARGDG